MRVISEGTAQAVAELVAKGGNACEAVDVVLHRQGVCGKLGSTGGPSFAIDVDGGVYLVQGLADGSHRLQVVDAHEVEAEAVHMILLHPILHALHHIAAHHGALRGGFVATAGSIGKGAVRTLAVEVSGHGALEVAALGHGGVVIHHVHHHADACPVQSHHHLLELADTRGGVVGIGRVRAFGGIVVLGVVSPVVLGLVEAGFIHRRIIERREDVNVGDTQFLQVVDARFLSSGGGGAFLGQGQELASVRDARERVDGEIPVVHLIEDDVRKALQFRADILVPTFGVGRVQVKDGGAVSIDAHGLGPYTGRIAQPGTIHLYIKGIELAVQVARYFYAPHPAIGLLHREDLDGFAAQPLVIELQADLFSGGRPQGKLGARRSIDHFFPFPFRHGILVILVLGFLHVLASHYRQCRQNQQVLQLHGINI